MAPEFWCQTTPTEFWCHGISGAKLHFADVAPLLEFGTKSLAPRLPWGARGVKEKNKDSDNGAAKDVVVEPVVDEPLVTVSGNSSGTQDGNVVSSTATLVEGNVIDSSSDPNKPGPNLAISKWFDNMAYAFFLGKRVAYPVVANYVKNTWGKYGLVWVKLHGVLVTAFSEDGLSVISTKLGTLLMLDSHTSNMCMQSRCRSSYVRAMIELRADMELKDTIIVAMPKLVGEGFYTCTVHVEYEWKLSHPSRNSDMSLTHLNGLSVGALY
ncbi:hypothetical protein Tco_1517831 [Tanacetum coccineum]